MPGTRHYTLGPLAFELGIAAQPYFDLGTLAAARLERLARELQGSLFVKVRSGVDSVCVARHDGARAAMPSISSSGVSISSSTLAPRLSLLGSYVVSRSSTPGRRPLWQAVQPRPII